MTVHRDVPLKEGDIDANLRNFTVVVGKPQGSEGFQIAGAEEGQQAEIPAETPAEGQPQG
jgi:hypothetical protein